MNVLYRRINHMLADGMLDDDEKTELMETLNQFARRDFELGEILQSTSLPLDTPAPVLTFPGQRYCFTGTFNFGCRRDCEEVVEKLGAEAGTLTQRTHVLVVGIYATDSWRHSSFGNKIMKACEWRDAGLPISEVHWKSYLTV